MGRKPTIVVDTTADDTLDANAIEALTARQEMEQRAAKLWEDGMWIEGRRKLTAAEMRNGTSAVRKVGQRREKVT